MDGGRNILDVPPCEFPVSVEDLLFRQFLAYFIVHKFVIEPPDELKLVRCSIFVVLLLGLLYNGLG